MSNGEPTRGDRDEGGRFAKGNRAGKGNPYSKQISLLRCELANALTREDIRELARALLKKAKKGSVPAAKLLLAYCIGQPVQLPVTCDGLEDGEDELPGAAVGMASGSWSEFLGKVEEQFCKGSKSSGEGREPKRSYKVDMAEIDRIIEENREKERQQRAARAAKRK